MSWKLNSRLLAVIGILLLMSACVPQGPGAVQQTPEITDPPVSTTEVPVPTQEIVTPEVTTAPTETPTPEAFRPAVAYIGLDGNVWMTDYEGKEQVQITFDAADYSSGGPVVVYQRPKWSSDGMLLGYERQEGTPVESGYTFGFSLWVYDLAKAEANPVYQGGLTSYDWKPGTHQVAFTYDIDPNYFGMRPELASDLAKGVSLLDVETGEVTDQVQPERGYHLVDPRWSPDGRFISFREVYLQEGSGMFAYYDLAGQEYFAWDEPIGAYSWSHDGEVILYDTLTYVPQGNEAIYTRPRAGGESMQFSPLYEIGYAYSPVYSANSELVAYLADFGSPESRTRTLYYTETANGQPVSLGEFEDAGYLSFTAGWPHILMTQGPWDNAEIILVSPTQGTVQVLAHGSQPVWNPALTLQ